MSSSQRNCQGRVFLTPPPKWKSNRCAPVMPRSERNPWSSVNDHRCKNDVFHVVHKVPSGDSPYVKAKHAQVIDKDPNRAVSMFWAAINAGDRVESALKDMAIVMKQLNRSDEAIEAIKSFRYLCPPESQESIDNILVELYKKSGKIEEEIQLLREKIKNIEELSFEGKRTKIARSQGKKIEITIDKEYSRLLGNLAWALLQLKDYKSAEEAYRKSLSFEPDDNKKCNLAICLIHLNKISEAKFLLHNVRALSKHQKTDGSHVKSFERATEILNDIELLSKPMEREDGVYAEWREDGVYVEGQTPLPLGLKSAKGFPTSTERFIRSQEVRHDQWETQHARLEDSQHCKDRNLNFSGSSQVNLRGTSWDRSWYENQFSNGRVEGDSRREAYVSPGSVSGTPRVPFTQPRKCLWQSKEDIRTNCIANDAVGRCNRKLTFKQHKGCDAEFNSTGLKASDCENWRKPMRTMEHHATTSSELSKKCDLHLDCKNNAVEVDQLENVVNGVITSMRHVSIADHEQGSTNVPAGDSISEDAEKNNQKGMSLLQTNRSPNESHTRKKSWAEMVEEDEDQLQQLSTTDDFADENYNINFVSETPMSLSKPQNRNDELSSTKKGYYTQPLNGLHVSMPPSANKEKCFDSPLQKRVLDFECSNTKSLSVYSSSGGHLKMKTKRLQVFQDITPESPTC